MHKLPTKLYTAAQVKELDRLVMAECGIPGIELMSRAGNAVFRHLRIKWPNAKSVSVFCGAGNNADNLVGLLSGGIELRSAWILAQTIISKLDSIQQLASTQLGSDLIRTVSLAAQYAGLIARALLTSGAR